MECLKGSYSPGDGGKACIQCSLGSFARSNKADRCELAKRGHYVDKEGASEEKECKRAQRPAAEAPASVPPAPASAASEE